MSHQGIREKLERARKELLELSTRSRLLSTPRRQSRVRTVEVVDELSPEIYRILVSESRRMSFLPAPEPTAIDEVSNELPGHHLAQPGDEHPDSRGIAARHRDNRLQTNLASERLQSRLLQIYYDARTLEEEQGISTLYFAVGFLRWFEADSSDRERYAPLVLIPVVLDRTSAQSRFTVAFSDEDISTNLSLQAKLRMDFGVDLPDLPEPEDLDISAYFDEVAKSIEGLERWSILPNDIVLGQFSFAKFLMYRDLDPDNWPESRSLIDHPLITGLLSLDGFASAPSDAKVEEIIARKASTLLHIQDADGSQALAIEEVRSGTNLVVQGPPDLPA